MGKAVQELEEADKLGNVKPISTSNTPHSMIQHLTKTTTTQNTPQRKEPEGPPLQTQIIQVKAPLVHLPSITPQTPQLSQVETSSSVLALPSSLSAKTFTPTSSSTKAT